MNLFYYIHFNNEDEHPILLDEIRDIDGGYVICQDKFERKWKLTPNTNENIIMPFIIIPLEARK